MPLMSQAQRNKLISDAQRRLYEADAETIQFFRRNPAIASEMLLGIKLFDAQKWILQEMWNKNYVVLCCSRNFGKSFIGAVFLLLKAILYPNSAIYIVSSSGQQSKELFNKIEEIVTRIGKTAASIQSLKDIAQEETVKNPNNKNGFSHAPEMYEVSFWNGSAIYTLNSNPDRVRSRRATIVFFDEAAYCSDELIAAAEAFATQESNFVTSTDDSFSPLTQKRKCGTQLIYASSQDDAGKLFYRRYREYAKEMLAGNRDYFVVDMIADTAIQTYMNGKPYVPLLTQGKVDAAMKINRDKALREYYNVPTRDGGENQIVKWGQVRECEKFSLPKLRITSEDETFVIAMDPARTNDNSIVSVMELVQDPEKGLCGRIVNCVNFIDSLSGKFKLDSNRQIKKLRDMVVAYNGADYADYVHLDLLEIDAGSGGGGVSTYGDAMLNDFVDSKGNTHYGFIDSTYEVYAGFSERYPNAIDKMRLLSPKKLRTIMIEETIELIRLGVIQFPYEFKDSDYIQVIGQGENGEEIMVPHEVTSEEREALMNIDLMKNELTSIHKFSNADGTAATYALALDKRSRMHDDRFYTLVMLGHRLYELRRKTKVRQPDEEIPIIEDYSCVSSVSF